MELITERQANIAFTVLPVLGLIVAAIVAALAKRRNANAIAEALLYGGPLVAIGILWRVYGLISGWLGSATVVNLLANLALFVVVGAAIGAVWTRWVPAAHDIAPQQEATETENGKSASV